jgi:hypothetical protein
MRNERLKARMSSGCIQTPWAKLVMGCALTLMLAPAAQAQLQPVNPGGRPTLNLPDLVMPYYGIGLNKDQSGKPIAWIWATVQNVGAASAPPTKTSVTISGPGGVYVFTRTWPALAPGQGLTLAIGAGPAEIYENLANYDAVFMADAGNSAWETDEANNKITVSPADGARS